MNEPCLTTRYKIDASLFARQINTLDDIIFSAHKSKNLPLLFILLCVYAMKMMNDTQMNNTLPKHIILWLCSSAEIYWLPPIKTAIKVKEEEFKQVKSTFFSEISFVFVLDFYCETKGEVCDRQDIQENN